MRPAFPYALGSCASKPDAPACPRWNRLADYFMHKYGERVRKIPLDAGFSCPNRDGSLSRSGCIFCNEQGSGTGLGLAGLSLAEQWAERTAPLLARGTRRFVAYLQSFSNTYGPIERLAAALDELKGLPGLTGLAVGTRPDCVDAEKLALIARACAAEGWTERWMEYGVQSCHDATLQRINRGHGRAEAEAAIALARAAGLDVCLHLIAGLPGEGPGEFLQSVRWASAQPIQGIKFHALYVCQGTALARMYEEGDYTPLAQDEYVESLAEALTLLRPDIIVQRLGGDPAPGELLAPAWAASGRESLNALGAELKRRDAWQGKNCPMPPL